MGPAARRAARIYNKHLDALCEHEPLTQMVLRAGDITWFDPNWYQTARAPRPPPPPRPARPRNLDARSVARRGPGELRSSKAPLSAASVCFSLGLGRPAARTAVWRAPPSHAPPRAPRLTRMCARAAQHQLENHTDDFCCTIQGAPWPDAREVDCVERRTRSESLCGVTELVVIHMEEPWRCVPARDACPASS
jgi:hypothetical protein